MQQLSMIKTRKRTRGIKWGRPVSTGTGARREREEFKKGEPLHITIKLREGLPNLRSRVGAQMVKNAIIGAQLGGMRVLHFSILSNHIHLLVEAESRRVLFNSMRSFCIRLAIH